MEILMRPNDTSRRASLLRHILSIVPGAFLIACVGGAPGGGTRSDRVDDEASDDPEAGSGEEDPGEPADPIGDPPEGPPAGEPPQVSGDRYYVATDGDDGQSCDEARNIDTPKRTLAGAQSCPGPGDALVLRGGEYPDADHILVTGTSWEAPVTIMAHEGELVIVRGLALGATGAPSAYIIVHGIIFDAADTLHVPFNVNWGHHIRIQGCELRNGQHSGMQAAGGDVYQVINVNSHHNGTGPNTACNDPEVNGGQCHGIYLSGPGILIEGGEIHDNEGWGVHLYSHPEQATVRNVKAYNQDVGIGIIFGNGPHEVSGNEVYGNSLGMWLGSSPVHAFANTIHDNDVGMDIDFGNTIQGNTFYDNNVHIDAEGENVVEDNTMD
jgi:hypothetical protein